MKREVDVTLRGASLKAVDPKIIGVRVVENPVAFEMDYMSNGALSGQAVNSWKRKELNISVFVKIKELYDMTERMRVVDAINKWAGTWHANPAAMQTSYRPGKKILVRLSKPIAPGDIREYTSEFELVFTADGEPYWSGQTPNLTTLEGTAGSQNTAILGNAPTPIGVTIIPQSAMSFIAIMAGDKQIVLDGFSAAANESINIAHDNFGIMSVKKSGVSLYGNLSPSFDDNLIISPTSYPKFEFTADAPATVYFMEYGRWL